MRFLLALLTGLFAVLTQIWRRPRNAKLWFGASFVCALLSVLLVFNYENAVETRTAPYDGRQVVIGSELTPMGRATERPGVLAEDRIMDAGGRVALVWTQGSIHRNASTLLAAYLGAMIGGALCVLLVLEAASRASARR